MKIAQTLAILILAAFAYAQVTEYPHVMDNGGGGASNGMYKQVASIGQAVIGIAGNTSYGNQAGYITAGIGPYLGIKEEPEKETTRPLEFELSQNYPNPFNSITRIDFCLPQDGEFIFNVFNSIGEKIYTETGNKKAGWYIIEYDPGRLPSGIYYYELKSGEKVARKKMLLLK